MPENTFGDHRRGAPPVPFPNTAVKPSAADGSWTLCPARVGYCQITARLSERKVGSLCVCTEFCDSISVFIDRLLGVGSGFEREGFALVKN